MSFNNENNQLPIIETHHHNDNQSIHIETLEKYLNQHKEQIIKYEDFLISNEKEIIKRNSLFRIAKESNCKYYFVKIKGSGYFKYTRSIEPFENDNLFQYLNFTSEEFIEFLKKIRYTGTLTKIVYYIGNLKDGNKIIKFSDYLSPMIKIFCTAGVYDWWCTPGLEISYPETYFYNLNAFCYSRIRYIVCTDYKTLGFFLNKNLEEYKKNIISWDIHNCYDDCFVNLNNNPINKILVSGAINYFDYNGVECFNGYPERTKLINFNNVCRKEIGNNIWSDESAYSQYLNQYICCFSTSNYPYNMTTNKSEYSSLILLKTYEILGSGALLLSPLNQKEQLAKIGLIENVNCMFVDMSDDNKIQEKIDFILNEQNRKIIDNIRKNGQNHGRNYLSSKKKYEILKELIINYTFSY
jgi:hypothetical protein